MDAKFVFVILCVEIAALYFGVHHLEATELDVYESHDETPIQYEASNVSYTCFRNVSHCDYDSNKVKVINIIHFVAISVAIAAYICVFVFLLRAYCAHRSLMKRNPHHTISTTEYRNTPAFAYRSNRLYKFAEVTILFVTGLNTILLGIQYHYDSQMIEACSASSKSIRIENLTTYILINAMEFSYIFFDLVFSSDKHHSDEHLILIRGENSRTTVFRTSAPPT